MTCHSTGTSRPHCKGPFLKTPAAPPDSIRNEITREHSLHAPTALGSWRSPLILNSQQVLHRLQLTHSGMETPEASNGQGHPADEGELGFGPRQSGSNTYNPECLCYNQAIGPTPEGPLLLKEALSLSSSPYPITPVTCGCTTPPLCTLLLTSTAPTVCLPGLGAGCG